ncbi:hypothetical protein [Geofilum rubicundum]|uniref:Uncharacterized protein n=1 Tax=Geofilum rubicundum JCM 15548 TaxID=1236989 RepID=A0A0E9LRZ1_9BACT|nr:hypothetical protein [Geofilum rubicundum]GAO28058.1 hypothetical protein JCM15548_116 [Geofilum rubicundum JCM 15548]
MTTKAINWTIIVILLFGLGTWGCDDDDKVWVADSDPELSLTAEEIHSDQGRTIQIKGNIKDELGIKSIHLNIDEWFLDREILISSSDSLVKDYPLDYAFLVPEDAEEKGHIIKVTVYNMGNRSVSQNVTIYMDGDFDGPTMTINSPVNGLTQAPDEEIPVDLSVDLSDARQLGYFIVEEASLEFRDSISYMGSGLTAANYSNTVMLPATVLNTTLTLWWPTVPATPSAAVGW